MPSSPTRRRATKHHKVNTFIQPTTILLLATALCLLADPTKAILPSLEGKKPGDILPFCLFPEVWPTSLPLHNGFVDPVRYRGLWYEIARLPNPFQTECVCSTAQYSLEKLRIGVLNTCTRVSGEKTSGGPGFAVPVNAANTWLKVYFNIFGGNYMILDIGDSYDYGHVMVGGPCRQYLWILARTKQLPSQKIVELLRKARRLGFDTDKMIARSPAAYC